IGEEVREGIRPKSQRGEDRNQRAIWIGPHPYPDSPRRVRHPEVNLVVRRWGRGRVKEELPIRRNGVDVPRDTESAARLWHLVVPTDDGSGRWHNRPTADHHTRRELAATGG